MKKFNLILSIVTFVAISKGYSQNLNWRNMDSNSNHFLTVDFGADYSIYYGVSYGYNIKNNLIPLVIGSEFNIPFGSEIFDDWKSRTSIQAEIWHNKHFSWSVQPGFIARRFESDIARLANLGADFTTSFGYQKPKWGIAATINYDKALTTHIRNKVLKEYYPEIRDGWYGTTGGNFKFGACINYSIKSWNVFLHLGKTYAQNFKDNPTLPFYGEISLQKQF